MGKGSRQFLVDILTLVAVALGQEFGLKRGLEGFGFWSCFGGPGGFFPGPRRGRFFRNPVGVGFFLRVCCLHIKMSDTLQMHVPTFGGQRSSFLNYE